MDNNSKDLIMAQIYVAFGQGTGFVRVSRETCAELYSQYYNRITQQVIDEWGTTGVQVLERMRALGRQMATNAAIAGQTVLAPHAQSLGKAATTVEAESDTGYCGGSNPGVKP